MIDDNDQIDDAEDVLPQLSATVAYGDVQSLLDELFEGSTVAPFTMRHVLGLEARPTRPSRPAMREQTGGLILDTDDDDLDVDDVHDRQSERDGFSSGWIELIRRHEIAQISRQVRARRITRGVAQLRRASDLRLLPGTTSARMS